VAPADILDDKAVNEKGIHIVVCGVAVWRQMGVRLTGVSLIWRGE